jgi:prepilin-type processing-associated H-X9-DG protein
VFNAVNHGWGPFILPFIEEQPLFDRYHWDLKLSDPLNQEVVAHPLKIFHCPSAAPNRFYFGDPFASYGGKGVCGDYAPTWYVDPALTRGDSQGVLTPNCMTKLTDITDGASNTILLTEDAGRPRQWRAGRPGDDQTIDGGPWAGFWTGITLQGSTFDGTNRPGPCALNCTNERQVYSFHPGGANAVFGDGSVHFLKAGMSIRILAALVTRAGGENVSAADYLTGMVHRGGSSSSVP